MGLKVEELWVGVLLYADDMILMAESEEELKVMMKVVDRFSRKWRFRVSVKKSKVMVCGESKMERSWRLGRKQNNDQGIEMIVGADWWIGGKMGGRIEEVDSYKYLGIELERCGKWRLVVDKFIEKTSSGCRCLFVKGGK